MLRGYSMKSSDGYIILMFVCSSWTPPDPKQPTQMVCRVFGLVSISIDGLDSAALSVAWGSESCASSPCCPPQTGRTASQQTSNCHLVSCVCCLISLFWIRLSCQHMLKIKCSNDAEWDFQIMILRTFFSSLPTYM